MANSRSPELSAESRQAETEPESRQAQAAAEPRQARAGGGEGPDRAAAGKDLGAALVIAFFAALTVVFSIRLDVPGSISTAPGLFPVIIGFTLFAMSVILGWRAIRAGATLVDFGDLPRRWANACRAIGLAGKTGGGNAAETAAETGGETGGGAARETTRTALLMAMVTAYVFLVGLINFEISLPLGFFTARISSYEVISMVMVAWILRLFWQAHPARCLIVALVSVELLASIFRYGFGIPMPAGY
ncbi:MAG: tripartite tricarboxylate transporter TctB family protein [Gammaproteobacteria bacterium]|nr:tripartite tricarboxylate transporter TctB family protein [Gammaproteobacteria bacterium]